uniref:Sushi domain-containing protein n=1 Tax=Panagrolaimus sp. PS1159 TaxID=55785 RepID=A0AC35FR32_9BILA
CLYDYTMLNAKIIGHNSKDTWNTFVRERMEAVRQYNSCGPINIEYPEYLMKTPALAPAYMQGDAARFECFQTHWIKGDHEYKCQMVVDYNDYNRYRFEWNKGSQPWCRSREFENMLKWLTAICSVVAIIMIMVLIFLCCWCVKQKRRQEQDQGSENSRLRRDIDSYNPRTDTLSNYSDKRDTFTRLTPNGVRTDMKPDDSPPYSTPELRSRHRHDPENEKLLGLTTPV